MPATYQVAVLSQISFSPKRRSLLLSISTRAAGRTRPPRAADEKSNEKMMTRIYVLRPPEFESIVQKEPPV